VSISQEKTTEILIHEIKVIESGFVGITYELSLDPRAKRFEKAEFSPSFRKTLNTLLDYVIDICLLERKSWSTAEITSVIFRYLEGDDEYRITVKNNDSPILTPIIVTTPPLKPFVVSEDLRAKLDLIQEEALVIASQRLEEKKLNPQPKKASLAELRKRLGTENWIGQP
jgi:hypothetical protein